MATEEVEVVFAGRKFEDDYKRLARSGHSEEEKRLYQVLTTIREEVRRLYRFGKKLPRKKIPDVYVQRFQIDNLWSLDLPSHGTVLYSIAGNRILIVDLLG